jgi:tetratricopeptide (TPR) repeat protein
MSILVHFWPMTSGGGSPEDGDEYFRKGLALSREGRWKEAVDAYLESLRMNPANAQTYLNLGFVYYELGYDGEAQQAFEKASKLQARPCTR